jgi:hypothetical protein
MEFMHPIADQSSQPATWGSARMKLETTAIPFRADILALGALMVYCVSAMHELLHHVTGAFLCHAGRMSLDLFIGGDHCPASIAMSAAGPVLNYVLLWAGASLVCATRSRLLGIGLVTASMPLVRYVGIAMGGNDEGVIARMLLDPATARVAAPVIAGLLLLPPAILTAFALPARRRWLVWTLLMSAPLLVLLPKKWLDQQLFSAWMRDSSVTLPNLGGVPWSVLVIHAVVVIALAMTILLARRRASAIHFRA